MSSGKEGPGEGSSSPRQTGLWWEDSSLSGSGDEPGDTAIPMGLVVLKKAWKQWPRKRRNSLTFRKSIPLRMAGTSASATRDDRSEKSDDGGSCVFQGSVDGDSGHNSEDGGSVVYRDVDARSETSEVAFDNPPVISRTNSGTLKPPKYPPTLRQLAMEKQNKRKSGGFNAVFSMSSPSLPLADEQEASGSPPNEKSLMALIQQRRRTIAEAVPEESNMKPPGMKVRMLSGSRGPDEPGRRKVGILKREGTQSTLSSSISSTGAVVFDDDDLHSSSPVLELEFPTLSRRNSLACQTPPPPDFDEDNVPPKALPKLDIEFPPSQTAASVSSDATAAAAVDGQAVDGGVSGSESGSDDSEVRVAIMRPYRHSEDSLMPIDCAPGSSKPIYKRSSVEKLWLSVGTDTKDLPQPEARSTVSVSPVLGPSSGSANNLTGSPRQESLAGFGAISKFFNVIMKLPGSMRDSPTTRTRSESSDMGDTRNMPPALLKQTTKSSIFSDRKNSETSSIYAREEGASESPTIVEQTSRTVGTQTWSGLHAPPKRRTPTSQGKQSMPPGTPRLGELKLSEKWASTGSLNLESEATDKLPPQPSTMKVASMNERAVPVPHDSVTFSDIPLQRESVSIDELQKPSNDTQNEVSRTLSNLSPSPDRNDSVFSRADSLRMDAVNRSGSEGNIRRDDVVIEAIEEKVEDLVNTPVTPAGRHSSMPQLREVRAVTLRELGKRGSDSRIAELQVAERTDSSGQPLPAKGRLALAGKPGKDRALSMPSVAPKVSTRSMLSGITCETVHDYESTISSSDEEVDAFEEEEDDGMVLQCRICEAHVAPKDLLEHSDTCLLATQSDVNAMECDLELLRVLTKLESVIQPAKDDFESMAVAIHKRSNTAINNPIVTSISEDSPASRARLNSITRIQADDSFVDISKSPSPRMHRRQLSLSARRECLGNSIKSQEIMTCIKTIVNSVSRGDLGSLDPVRRCEHLGQMMDNLLQRLKDVETVKAEAIDLANEVRTLIHNKTNALRDAQHYGKERAKSLAGPATQSLSALSEEDNQSVKGKTYSQVSIKDFDVLEPVKKGAYGSVFVAKKKATGDVYAIKVVAKNSIMKQNKVEGVKAERDILAFASEHPSIVSVYFTFQNARNLFFVMEYLNGGDCSTLLANIMVIPEDYARFYMAECFLALFYLHEHGIIHRDVKPDNMLLGKDGHIRLTDFGLSFYGLETRGWESEKNAKVKKELSQESIGPHARTSVSSHEETQERFSVIGTPNYVAPEVINGEEAGREVDLWACGVILLQFLSGYPPFYGNTVDEIFEQITEFTCIDWEEYEDCEISEEAVDLINRLMDPNPKTRLGHGSVDEIKNHPFFSGVNWDKIVEQAPPWIPEPESATDTSYFDCCGQEETRDFSVEDSELLVETLPARGEEKVSAEDGFEDWRYFESVEQRKKQNEKLFHEHMMNHKGSSKRQSALAKMATMLKSVKKGSLRRTYSDPNLSRLVQEEKTDPVEERKAKAVQEAQQFDTAKLPSLAPSLSRANTTMSFKLEETSSPIHSDRCVSNFAGDDNSRSLQHLKMNPSSSPMSARLISQSSSDGGVESVLERDLIKPIPKIRSQSILEESD